MADQLPDIKSRLIIDDKQVGEVLGKVGKQAETMGHDVRKNAEVGKLGLWGMGEAAENAAQSMGVPAQMSKKLGNTVEGLVGSLGKGAIAFGLVGVAAMGLYGVYSSLAEEKQKVYDETMRQGQAAGALITSLIDERSYTEKLKAEIEDLNKKKREMAAEDLQRAIDAQTRKINEMGAAIADQGGILSQFRAKWQQIKTLIADGKYISAQEAIRNETAGLTREQEKQIMVLQELFLQQEKYQTGLTKKQYENQAAYTPMEFEQIRNALALEKIREQIDALDSYYTESDEQRRARELAEYNSWVQRNQWAADSTQYQIQQEERLNQFRAQSLTNMASFLTQSFQAMYNAGGSHARRNFSLFKTAAIAETIINADKSAASAYAWGSTWGGPALGTALAAIAYAAGWARVQSIRKQQFDGGGGGGGGAPVTYGGSSAIVPAYGQGNGGAMNLTLNINGQQAGMYEITKGVLRTLWSNNGSIDGLSVNLEQSA